MIKIVADSGCDFTNEMRNNEDINITQVPLSLQLAEKKYIDDLNLDMDMFIDDLCKCTKGRKTAAPSPELFLEAYKGEEDIFALTISSNLSGSYNSAMTAKNMYLEDIGNKFIHVFDSLSASAGEVLVALKINELAKLKLKNEEIVNKVTEFIKNMKTYFILEKYDTLIDSGRLNPYVAKLASVLNIVPICGAVDGKTVLKGQAKGQKKAFKKLIDMIEAENVNFSERILAITHISCLDKAIEFKNEILSRINFKNVILTQGSGLCSLYADHNGLIIAF